jgi:hypothetical protein
MDHFDYLNSNDNSALKQFILDNCLQYFDGDDTVETLLDDSMISVSQDIEDEGENHSPAKKKQKRVEEEQGGIWKLISSTPSTSSRICYDSLSTRKSTISAELSQYLAQPTEVNVPSLDPTTWWQSAVSFGHLRPFALRLCSAPPSSAPCEQLFSSSKRVFTDIRNRLQAQNGSMLTITMANMALLNYEYELPTSI